ncbi:MAG: FkbM family methyltransferase [Stappiaceae bacterium]
MIQYEFHNGRISGAGVAERIGIGLMRSGAHVLAPFEFLGFSWISRIVRSVVRSNEKIQVRLFEDSVFEYPYGDGYWGVLLYNKQPYAPDVEPYLKSFADIDYAFIDCGANFGYMSVVVSSAEYGSKPAIAIEADPQNYEKTVRNSELNGSRYDCRHNAVFSESGKVVKLFGAKHEARTIVEEAGGQGQFEVETLALNGLSGWLHQQGSPAVILKLDVEGVEIDALAGADEILAHDCLISYEEHGSDPSHEVSRHLKEKLGMRLFLGAENTLHIREIIDFADLDSIKSNARRGYDLFATNSAFWIDRLSTINVESD